MGCAVGLAPPQVLLVELAQRELEVARNRVEVHVDRVILVGMAGATLHPPVAAIPLGDRSQYLERLLLQHDCLLSTPMRSGGAEQWPCHAELRVAPRTPVRVLSGTRTNVRDPAKTRTAAVHAR